MSMTREEANKHLHDDWYIENGRLCVDGDKKDAFLEAAGMGIKALRPVSRERVEKMKKAPIEGEYDELYAPTYECPECGFWNTGSGNFCRNCGCLHTDEAVQMVMRRLEALHENRD